MIGERGVLGLDQKSQNHAALFHYVKQVKVQVPPAVRLPNIVQITAQDVLCGFFPENGCIWIGAKFNYGRTHTRDSYIEDSKHRYCLLRT